MKHTKLLTEAQTNEIKSEMLPTDTGVPCRFLVNGQCLQIGTGNLMRKGVNVIHQWVYWRFTKETAKKIATWLDAKVVF